LNEGIFKREMKNLLKRGEITYKETKFLKEDKFFKNRTLNPSEKIFSIYLILKGTSVF
jgi:hypothetical protein